MNERYFNLARQSEYSLQLLSQLYWKLRLSFLFALTAQLRESRMAEAFPEEPSASELHPDERVISVLLLAITWQFDTYGLSTINKSLINNLRLVDPEGKTIKITCAVVEEEEKIKDVDVNDAENSGVVLKGAKKPMSRNRKSKPELSWLDEYAGAYYRNLEDKNFDFIIGHAPYLANGCFNLKDQNRGGETPPKIMLVFHDLPKDENGDIDNEMVSEWLNKCDVVISIGKAVESELVPYIADVDEESRPISKMYIPSYPLELFHVVREEKGKEVVGTQNITMMSAEFKDLDVTGLDFPLAVNATIAAAEHIRDFDGVRTNLTMLAAQEDDRGKWKEEHHKVFKKKNADDTGLSFKVEVPTDITELQSSLKRSTLFILPMKPDSPLFGTEALSAIAAGVPVLVSKCSGIARCLQKMVEDESVVFGTKLQSRTDIWKDRMLERLLRPEESQRKANRLREQLLLDTTIAKTHLNFINIIASKFSAKFYNTHPARRLANSD